MDGLCKIYLPYYLILLVCASKSGGVKPGSWDTLENYMEVSEANHSGKFPNKRSGKKRTNTTKSRPGQHKIKWKQRVGKGNRSRELANRQKRQCNTK